MDDLKAYTLKIQASDSDREEVLHYASPFEPLEEPNGHEEVYRTCGAVHDTGHTWEVWAGERLGDDATCVLVVPHELVVHAVGLARHFILEVRRERVIAAAMACFDAEHG